MSAIKSSQVAVIGGGPTGLTAAIMLARRGYTNINVYERLAAPQPPDDPVWLTVDAERTYNIGIGGRGQSALKELDAMDIVDKYSVPVIGRYYWEPETPAMTPLDLFWTNRTYTTKCIPRDCLTACLMTEIITKYNNTVNLNYNTHCYNVSWSYHTQQDVTTEVCNLHLMNVASNSSAYDTKTVQATLVLGTDGVQSAVRESMLANMKKEKFFVKKFKDTNARVYRTIPLYFNRDSNPPLFSGKRKWRSDINYSIRTKTDINIDALPLRGGTYLGVVLFRPWDERFRSLKTAQDAKALFEKIFPMFSSSIRNEDLEIFATKRDSNLPIFSYAGPVLHK